MEKLYPNVICLILIEPPNDYVISFLLYDNLFQFLPPCVSGQIDGALSYDVRYHSPETIKRI